MNLNMKKILSLIIAIILIVPSISNAQAISYPNRGGTGTSTVPTLGQVLVGQSNGTYAPQATSTLGLPTFTTLLSYLLTGNFNSLFDTRLNATTTLPNLSIPIGQVTGTIEPLYIAASSTLLRSPSATTTNLSVVNITVGSVTATSTTATSTFPIASSTCFWNGTACLTASVATTPAGSNGQIQFNNNGVFGGMTTLFLGASSYNFGAGIGALNSNTGGQLNNAIGFNALYNNTIGSSNNAIGLNALYNNTRGSANHAIGAGALYYNTTGSNNIGIGTNAGKDIANGADGNFTSSDSIYIGKEIRSGASGNTNEIVIGVFAIGNGSDSATLGNTSITKTVLQGNVGIGTTTPSNKLEVAGNGYFSGNLAATGTLAVTGTGTSTFLGSVMIGNSLNGGLLAPTGFVGIPFVNPSLQLSANPDSVTGGAGQIAGGITLANTGAGAYNIVPIIFNNASSTFVGSNSKSFAAIGFSGPNFTAYPGLPGNSLGIQVSDGAIVSAVSTSTASKAFFAWGVGPGYTSGNYDMVLKNISGTILGDGMDSGLGLGTTSPTAHLSIEKFSSSTYPFMNMVDFNSITGVRTPIFNVNDNGRVGIGTASPTSTLEVNGNITLSAGANRIINVTDATSTSGNALTVKSASGANSVGNSISNAGAMFILSGNGGSNTSYTGTSNAPDGGVINVTSGNGGSFSGASPHSGGGNSGQINITSGIPGTGITSNGQSGMVQIKTGAGISGVSQSLGGSGTGSIYMQPGDGGTAAPGTVGGNGGYIISTSGAGGTSIVSSAGTNTGGVSGNLAMTVASAGQANAGSINVGGNAGAMTFSGGAGGFGGNTVLVSTSTGGNGSSGTFTGGNGGYAKTSTANNRTTTGGGGGSFTFTGGNGGAATNGSVATAGDAGAFNFVGGGGGSASGGASNVGKSGGALNFTGGAGGAGSDTNGGSMYFVGGAKGASGVDGNIIFGMNSAGTARGNVGIGTTTPSSLLTVAGDIYIASSTAGILMKDTVLGSCYRIQMTSGVLTPNLVATSTCP